MLLGILYVHFVTDQLFNVPWSSVVCWGFLAMCFFYGTGHTPTFPGIQWEAAFVGTGGQFSNHIVPALLICINTFASHIVMSLMIPVLLVAPFTLHVMFSKILPSAAKDGVKSKDIKQGELVLYKKDDLLYEGTFTLCARYILFFGIRVSWVEKNIVACSCITYYIHMFLSCTFMLMTWM